MDEIDIWRADSAYEQGHMFNFELWRRITNAVIELQRDKPNPNEAVN
jgi:hypothetical protein